MSKTSYALIGLMVAHTFTFQNVPVSLAAPKPEPVSRPVAFAPVQSAIFLESAPLSEEQTTQQAQDTITSILDDYKEDPNLQKFNRELSAATHGDAADLGALSGGELVRILQENPQVRQVVQQNMQNPAFAKTVQEIFTNPQFVQSVQQLQGPISHCRPGKNRKKRNSNGKI